MTYIDPAHPGHRPAGSLRLSTVAPGAVVRWAGGSDNKYGRAQSKNPDLFPDRGFCLELDDDLLSHGETPHYHRRCVVSLLSSGWDQVVPTLYGRQAIL